jgi:hypothetical protein
LADVLKKQNSNPDLSSCLPQESSGLRDPHSGNDPDCAFQRAVRLAQGGLIPPGIELLKECRKPTTAKLRTVAAVAWNLAGRRDGGTFTLGIDQVKDLLGCEKSAAAEYINRLEAAGVIALPPGRSKGNNLVHRRTRFVWCGIRPPHIAEGHVQQNERRAA